MGKGRMAAGAAGWCAPGVMGKANSVRVSGVLRFDLRIRNVIRRRRKSTTIPNWGSKDLRAGPTMLRMMALLALASLLLACSLFACSETQTDGPAEQAGSPPPPAGEPTAEAALTVSLTQTDGPAEQTGSPPPPAGEPTAEAAMTVSLTQTDGPEVLPHRVDSFHGDTLVEQKILRNSTIVRATMASLASDVVAEPDSEYSAILKFTLNVHEYLKGAGGTSIVAVWVDGSSYDTRAKAEARKAVVLAERDTQWDSREAVIFLYKGVPTGYGTAVTELLQRADHFFLGFGDPYSPDDRYSLHSERNRDWLPAASAGSASGGSASDDDREYLLDVPAASGGSASDDDREYLLDVPAASEGASGASATPTITLANLKTRIREVTAEYNGGDGSAAYKTCVEEKYASKRMIHYFQTVKGIYAYGEWALASTLTSGQPANTVAHQRENYGIYPSKKARTWFTGPNAALFSVVQGAAAPYDLDKDGTFTAGVDALTFTETFLTVRPLPAGTYQIDRMEEFGRYIVCDYAIKTDWTVTVTSPAGTVHEAFFDPVTIGAGVGADATNGVLKPAGFSVGGTSTSITGLKWENGAVVLTLSPYAALTGQALDVIALNGSVSLTLAVSGATADATAGTLTWSRSAQPWQSGDKLMLRIRGQ